MQLIELPSPYRALAVTVLLRNTMMFAYAGPYGKLSASRCANRFGANVMSVLITLLVAGLVVAPAQQSQGASGLVAEFIAAGDGFPSAMVRSCRWPADLIQEFIRKSETSSDSGRWRYHGDTLTLNGERQYSFAVQMFQPGVISLIKDGTAELFHKQSNNVVSLAKR